MDECVHTQPGPSKGRRRNRAEVEERSEEEHSNFITELRSNSEAEDQRSEVRARPEQQSAGKRYPLLSVVCQGVLSLLILTTVIGLHSYCHNQLQTSYNKLQTSNSQLQTRNNNLTKDRDQLLNEVKHLNEKIAECDCPRGWQRFGNSSYYIPARIRNWPESRLDCLSRGSDLVVINSTEEQVFVAGLIEWGTSYWIGLSDLETEGTWKWVDGTPLTISNWRTGEPNDFYDPYPMTNEDCAGLYHHPEGWNDLPCSASGRWICEK